MPPVLPFPLHQSSSFFPSCMVPSVFVEVALSFPSNSFRYLCLKQTNKRTNIIITAKTMKIVKRTARRLLDPGLEEVEAPLESEGFCSLGIPPVTTPKGPLEESGLDFTVFWKEGS